MADKPTNWYLKTEVSLQLQCYKELKFPNAIMTAFVNQMLLQDSNCNIFPLKIAP